MSLYSANKNVIIHVVKRLKKKKPILAFKVLSGLPGRDSCTKLCQGMCGGRAFQWTIVRGKKYKLVVVFQSCDLSLCKRMILFRRVSIPNQVVSCRYGYMVICDLIYEDQTTVNASLV